MDIQEQIQTILSSTLGAAIVTTGLSSVLGAVVGLWTFRHQTRELIYATITWQWRPGRGGPDEHPFLTVQNRSITPAYLKNARYLRGVFIRREAKRYAFSYDEVTDGNFPLEIRPSSATSFPLHDGDADRIALKARWYSKALAYLLRRSFVWIEIATISGGKIMVPANDVTSFQSRPLWLTGRWLPEPKPDWSSLFELMEKKD